MKRPDSPPKSKLGPAARPGARTEPRATTRSPGRVRKTIYLLMQLGLNPWDLMYMLRGQILLSDRGHKLEPCRGAPPPPEHLPLAARDVPQLRIELHRKLPVLRSRLMCPIEERHRDSQSGLCATLYGPDSTSPLGPMLRTVGLRPCEVLYTLLSGHLSQLLGLGPRQAWPAGDVDPILLRAQSLSVDRTPRRSRRKPPGPTVPGHAGQRWLRFLLGSGRLTASELREMLSHGVFVTGEDGLPCDDPQRDMPAVSREKPPWVTGPRYMCPLQVRALRGDATTPCAEARRLQAPEALLRRVREGYPADALQRERPPQPKYWLFSDEQPGGPEDRVAEADVRPCEALGQVLKEGLQWMFDHGMDYAMEQNPHLRREVAQPDP